MYNPTRRNPHGSANTNDNKKGENASMTTINLNSDNRAANNTILAKYKAIRSDITTTCHLLRSAVYEYVVLKGDTTFNVDADGKELFLSIKRENATDTCIAKADLKEWSSEYAFLYTQLCTNVMHDMFGCDNDGYFTVTLSEAIKVFEATENAEVTNCSITYELPAETLQDIDTGIMLINRRIRECLQICGNGFFCVKQRSDLRLELSVRYYGIELSKTHLLPEETLDIQPLDYISAEVFNREMKKNFGAGLNTWFQVIPKSFVK